MTNSDCNVEGATTVEMRDHIKYSPIKARSKTYILAHSLFSNTFVKKYGILCIILCLGLGYLFYHRVLYQQYIYHTLPFYQRSIKLVVSSKSIEGQDQPDQWQAIGDPERRYKIYSAYFDPRLEVIESLPVSNGVLPFGSVRIFTILPLNIRRKEVSCNFRYANNHIVRQRADQVEPIHEHFDMPFAASFVVCKLVGNKHQMEIKLPDDVALSYESEPSMANATSFTRIHYPREDLLLRAPPTRGLAVCVGPAHHNYSNAARVVEFVEYWQLLGAERFYFYNKSITAEVDRVMDHYRARGVAEVLRWNVDGYEFERELRYEGIFAALNDCLYRATMMGDFRHTAMVDFDEFLLPLGVEQNSTTETLAQFLRRRDRFDVHSFNFQTVFFYGFYEEDFSRRPRWSNSTYLYTQVRNVRTRGPLMHHNRSKYVANGRNVIEAGNHFVWRALRDSNELRVSDREGLLFHYRDQCIGYGCGSFIEDNSARRYETKIWRSVDTVCRQIFSLSDGQCPLGEENH